MKVLFDHPNPFLLAHGGFQIQIEQTKKALEEIGVEVECLRWWDNSQTGDLIHYFGVPPLTYLKQANTKNLPVVLTQLLSAQCNRSQAHLKLQGIVTRIIQKLPGFGSIRNQLKWQSISAASKVIVGLEAERHVLKTILNLPDDRIVTIPLAISSEFFRIHPARCTQNHLITTGTISEVKRSVELAQMARAAEVPILFVGKPYSETDPYWMQFKSLIDGKTIMHQSHIESKERLIELLCESRGYVLYSKYENWSLSTHEAVACGLPICVQDQNWSRERFGKQAFYLNACSSNRENIQRLKDFYVTSHALHAPSVKLCTWTDTAAELKAVYEKVLSSS